MDQFFSNKQKLKNYQTLKDFKITFFNLIILIHLPNTIQLKWWIFVGTVEGGIYDKYNSDIACSLPGVHKLYNKLIAYQIFEIGFDRRRQCLKIDFEDFNETMAILKKSNWV